jgi:hypothetical protein
MIRRRKLFILANPSANCLPHFKIHSRPATTFCPAAGTCDTMMLAGEGCAGARLVPEAPHRRHIHPPEPASTAAGLAGNGHVHIPQPEPRVLQAPARAAQRLPHKARHHKCLRLRCRRHQQADLRRRHLRLIRRWTLRQHLIRRNPRLRHLAIEATSSPRRRIFNSAACSLCPVTSGIVTRVFPKLCATRTCHPRRTFVPGSGSCDMILPSGICGL